VNSTPYSAAPPTIVQSIVTLVGVSRLSRVPCAGAVKRARPVACTAITFCVGGVPPVRFCAPESKTVTEPSSLSAGLSLEAAPRSPDPDSLSSSVDEVPKSSLVPEAPTSEPSTWSVSAAGC
jgi:hypothetical protein